MTKQQILDSVIEQLQYASENFTVYAEDLERIRRKTSAENLRNIITDIECVLFDLRHTIK